MQAGQDQKQAFPLWLAICQALAIVLLLVVIVFGADRSYWYDEVYTLGFAAIGQDLDWALLKSDVHPPTYALLIRGMAGLFDMGPYGYDLRLVNLPALLAAIYGFWLLRQVFDPARLALLTVMLVVNFYTLMLGLDLRSYALLLGFGWLAHAAYLLELGGQRPRHATLILSCILLWSLHFFGAAIGLSLLAASALHGWRMGMARWAIALRLGLAAVLFALFCGWVFVASDVLASTGGKGWIRNGLDPLLNFVGWQAVAMLVLLTALVLRRRMARQGRAAPKPPRIILWLFLPGAMVLVAAAVISFHTPVISSRNLTVLVPPVLLAIAFHVPDRMLTPHLGFSARPLVAGLAVTAIVAVIGLRSADNGTRNGQMVEWVLREATIPECDGEPVYVFIPDQLDRVAQRVYFGRVVREPLNYLDYDPALISASCPVIGMGWHENGTVDDVVAFLAQRGTETVPVLPPDPRLAAARLLISGYVVRRAD
ncbi:hypothetical protein HMH01_04620 [Halovulum dunhuangense]|uniref:Dolichyl-phosphate-mannose-protein mannosyltransferase n=1 Tax=Halovulum dunhuangense TaxID=1505036 RepID=A0A849L0D7_9RHOB|nr:hypothetical protein [Halovulum dunhuangense]NNU79720.1 hypothetical protein [Halovulum dunhuangense]